MKYSKPNCLILVLVFMCMTITLSASTPEDFFSKPDGITISVFNNYNWQVNDDGVLISTNKMSEQETRIEFTNQSSSTLICHFDWKTITNNEGNFSRYMLGSTHHTTSSGSFESVTCFLKPGQTLSIFNHRNDVYDDYDWTCIKNLDFTICPSFTDSNGSIWSYYENDDRTCLITSYSGNDIDLVVPTTVKDENIEYVVTEITDDTFKNNTTITSVTLPESLISIGEEAFYGCTNLSTLIIPSSVTDIENLAFYNCNNLLEIWNYSNLNFTKGSTYYGRVAYYAKIIHTTNEPSSIFFVDNFGFYTDEDGLYHLCRYNGNESYIELPASYNDDIYTIDASAFQNKSFIQYVIIPVKVTSIEDGTFSGTSINKIFCLSSTPATLGGKSAIPQGTVYVPAGSKTTYSNTTNWKKRTIYEGCEDSNFALQLVDGSFFIVDAYIGDPGTETTQTIPSSALSGGTTYNVTMINDKAFTGNEALTNVVMPSSIESIGTYSFQDCINLKSVTLSKNITTLSSYAFSGCTSLENITILPGTITIDYCCFNGCENLKSIILSKNINKISSYAFCGCKSLSSISIPANCTSIAISAFEECSALKAFIVDENNTYYNTIDGVLTNYDKTEIIIYPIAKGSSYEIPSTITTIGEDAFKGSELTSISIPATVKYVLPRAFSSCNKLTTVKIEDSSSPLYLNNSSTKSDCTHTFDYSPIENLYIGRNLTGYSNYTDYYGAFYYTTTLKSLTIGGNATSLYARMFQNCFSLNSVTFGDNVTTIGENAFNGCYSLPSLALNEGITSIGSSAFLGCTSLASIKIPATVTSIGDSFLSGCSALKEINAKMQTPPTLQASAFTSVDKDACKLIVPAEYVETYSETPGWMAFNNIVAEDDASLRKMNVNLTDGGTVTIDSRTYTCEGEHSFYVSATEDINIVITPSTGYYLKSVKQNGALVTSKMVDNTLTLVSSGTQTTIDIAFAPSTETTDISALDYAIYTPEVTGISGKQVSVPVYLKNVNAISAWQADLILPDGFTLATDSYGDPMITLSGSRTTTTKHSIATSTVNGLTHILCSSSSNKTFSGTDGEVATITLNIADDAEEADYPIILKNQVIVETNEEGHEVDQVVSKITVQSYTSGDVNNDGKINAMDLVAVVNYILETPTAGNVRDAADLNNDGKIDARDYVAMVNMILSDGASSSASSSQSSGSNSSTEDPGDLVGSNDIDEGGEDAPELVKKHEYLDELSIAPFDILPNEEKEFDIQLDNSEMNYTCVQMDITLPEGISLVDAVSLSRGHNVAYQMLNDGRIRLLLSSMANKVIEAENGIIRLTVKADAGMSSGAYELQTNNALLVTPNGESTTPSAASYTFTVGEATGINSMAVDTTGNNAARYNMAGQRVNSSAEGIVITNGNKYLVK